MNTLLPVTFIIVLAAISPGPDFVMVVKNALLHNKKSGIFTALGISISLLIHSVYSILGLAFIISQSLFLFSLIKYLGAGYLIYIGTKSVLAKRSSLHLHASKNQIPTKSAFQMFSQGLLCNLLNPKAIMFILAFFTLIIKPSRSHISEIGFGVEIAVIHFIWFSWLAVMINHHRIKSRLNKIQHYLTKVMGIVLIGFGARIAFLHR